MSCLQLISTKYKKCGNISWEYQLGLSWAYSSDRTAVLIMQKRAVSEPGRFPAVGNTKLCKGVGVLLLDDNCCLEDSGA